MSIEQGKEISELFRRIGNLIRIGKVISVDYTKAKAKVKIGNLTTDYKRSWRKALKRKISRTWLM